LALQDALEDALGLRDLVSATFGEPAMVLLEGQSMGGTAAVLLVERRPDLFSAAVTVGAALMNAMLDFGQSDQSRVAEYGTERATGTRELLTRRPLAPLIFLVNESEVGPAHSYVEHAWKSNESGDDVVVPALWQIERAGHNWTNAAERLNAVLHAVSWVEGGTFITCRGTPHRPPPNIVPTVTPAVIPDGCTVDGRRATGQVVAVQPGGSFTVSIPRNTLASIGIKLRTRFHLHVLGEEMPPVRVTLDEYPYLATREYDWLALLEPEHEWMVVTVRTYEYCNAAKLAHVWVGSRVTVESVEKPVGKLDIGALKSRFGAVPS
jgi:hypothetical protein